MEKIPYYFDSIILYCLLNECKTALGEKVKGIKRDEKNNLYIFLEGSILFTSIHSFLYRVHLIQDKTINNLKKHRFDDHLKKLRVKEIRQLGLDRIFFIHFSNKNLDRQYYLVFELTGPSSNIFLLDRDKKILQQLRKTKKSREGEIYTLNDHELECLQKIPPEETLKEIVEEEKPSKIIERFFKKKPFWLRELMKDKDEKELKSAFRKILKRPVPYIHYEDDHPYFVSPLKVSTTSKKARSFNEAVTEMYAFAEKEEKKEKLKREIEKKIKSTNKILTKLKDDLVSSRNREELKTKAELILVQLKRIRKGIKKITVEDPYKKNKEIEIELDPSKSPVQNADEYFKKYRKLEKSQAIIERRIRETERNIKNLKSIKENIDTFNEKKLEELQNTFQSHKTGKKKVPLEERPFKTYFTSRGKTVLVGRDKFDNERLTFRFAKSKDLFFHVREAPGSHTILVNDGTISKDDILEAAQVAAHFSRAKHSTIVPVSYTEKRYVRKSKKLGAGKVLLSNEKTIFVEPNLPPTKE